MMKITNTSLNDVLIIKPEAHTDSRGFFIELFHQARYTQSGLPQHFVQDNLSFSVQHTLRGLHYQIHKAQAKLVQAITGEIFDVAVDIRAGSPSFGKWTGSFLSAENKHQMFIPEGFAHGFCVVSETAHVLYKCSDFYSPEDEGGIFWADPGIGIDWPVKNPVISEKDNRFQSLADILPENLPRLENTY